MQQNNKNDLRAYRIKSFTLLQLMALLATAGVLLTWILQHFAK